MAASQAMTKRQCSDRLSLGRSCLDRPQICVAKWDSQIVGIVKVSDLFGSDIKIRKQNLGRPIEMENSRLVCDASAADAITTRRMCVEDPGFRQPHCVGDLIAHGGGYFGMMMDKI